MVAITRTDVESALFRRDNRARISRNSDPISQWQYDLRVYIEKEGSLQDAVQVFAQKFIKMGITKNFVLTVLTDYMWHCLIIMWQSVLNLEIPKLVGNAILTDLARRCEHLQLQMHDCRSNFMAEITTSRCRSFGKRFMTYYEQCVFDMLPENPQMYFETEACMSPKDQEFFKNAIFDKIACAMMKGAEVSKLELEAHVRRIAKLLEQLAGVQEERNQFEILLEKQKRLLLQISSESGGQGNLVAELIQCQEDLAVKNGQVNAGVAEIATLKEQLDELEREYKRHAGATAEYAQEIKEAAVINSKLNADIKSLQDEYDDLKIKVETSAENDEKAAQVGREKDDQILRLQEEIKTLQDALQAADSADQLELYEKELADKTAEIVQFEMQVGMLEQQISETNEQLATQALGLQGSAEAQEKIAQLESSVRELEEREAQSVAIQEQLRAENSQLEMDMKVLECQGANNSEETAFSEKKIQTLEESMTRKEEELTTLRQEMDEVEAEATILCKVFDVKGTWRGMMENISAKPVDDIRLEFVDALMSLVDGKRTVSDPNPDFEKMQVAAQEAATATAALESTKLEMKDLAAQLHAAEERIKTIEAENKSAAAAQEAVTEKTKAEMSSVKAENARLKIALEELHKRLEEMKVMMATKGVDSSIVEAAFEQTGLAELVRGSDLAGRKVFERLYIDAMNRLHRQEKFRQRRILLQQEELNQVLHMLATPRTSPDTEVLDDFYHLLQRCPQKRTVKTSDRTRPATRERARDLSNQGTRRTLSPERPTSDVHVMRHGDPVFFLASEKESEVHLCSTDHSLSVDKPVNREISRSLSPPRGTIARGATPSTRGGTATTRGGTATTRAGTATTRGGTASTRGGVMIKKAQSTAFSSAQLSRSIMSLEKLRLPNQRSVPDKSQTRSPAPFLPQQTEKSAGARTWLPNVHDRSEVVRIASSPSLTAGPRLAHVEVPRAALTVDERSRF